MRRLPFSRLNAQTEGSHPVPPVPSHSNARTRPGLLRRLQLWRNETGAATAEYAIALLAAVGFAGLLVVILRGDEVREILTNLVRNALNSAP